jgi:sugar (pentulose or hexulose) kinase
MLSDISGLQLDFRTGGDVGPALGAARLAQIAMNPENRFHNCCRSLRLNRRICLTRRAMRGTRKGATCSAKSTSSCCR